MKGRKRKRFDRKIKQKGTERVERREKGECTPEAAKSLRRRHTGGWRDRHPGTHTHKHTAGGRERARPYINPPAPG